MISAKRARATQKQGKEAERRLQVQKPYWRAKTHLLRQLLILSTLLPQTQRRSCLRTLLQCFVIKKFSATRMLGRLFRNPLMNLSTTWTSRELEMDLNCSQTIISSSTSGSKDALRSVQKTSGLFDTVKASNDQVASKASKSAGLEMDRMDASVGYMPTEEDWGGFLEEMPLDLMEEQDFLDSFVDLSNFLIPEGSNLAVGSAFDSGELKAETPCDFAGIISHLEPEPTVNEVKQEIPTSMTPALRKRKYIDYGESSADECIVNVIDLDVSDHDYVTKKPKVAAAVTNVSPHHVTSTSQLRAAPYKSTDQYRERRDKNNEASRRSRQIRKQKYVDMDKEACELELKNEALRKKIVELEALAKTMKAALIKKMTEK